MRIKIAMYNPKLVVLSAALIIVGCSSQQPSLPSATIQAPQSIAPTEDSTTTEAIVELTPVQKLQAEPNLYLASAQHLDADVTSRFERALAKKEAGELEQAAVVTQNLIADHPTLSGPLLLKGDILVLQDKPDIAEAAYKRAIHINKLNYFAQNRLGTLLRAKGEFAQAKRHYEAALSSWPAFPEARLNLAILQDLYLGNKRQALEHYEIYQQLTDNSDRQVKGWVKDLSRQIKADVAMQQGASDDS